MIVEKSTDYLAVVQYSKGQHTERRYTFISLDRMWNWADSERRKANVKRIRIYSQLTEFTITPD